MYIVKNTSTIVPVIFFIFFILLLILFWFLFVAAVVVVCGFVGEGMFWERESEWSLERRREGNLKKEGKKERGLTKGERENTD